VPFSVFFFSYCSFPGFSFLCCFFCFVRSGRIGFSCITEDQLPSIRKEVNDIILPKHLKYFENFLSRSTTGWLASSAHPTIADFTVAPRLKSFTIPGTYEGISHQLLDPFPLSRQLIDKFYALPEIQSYYNAAAVTKNK
jgi:glutathione S-transferase